MYIKFQFFQLRRSAAFLADYRERERGATASCRLPRHFNGFINQCQDNQKSGKGEGWEARGKGRAEGLGWAAFHNWHRWDALIGKLYAIIDCRLTTVDGFRWKSYKLFEYSSIRNEPKVRSSFPPVDIETFRCCGSFRYPDRQPDSQHKYLALIAAYTSVRYSLGACTICWQFL